MAKTPLGKKLRFQAQQRALILNAPEDYVETLSQLPEGMQITEKPEPDVTYDFGQVFVKSVAELERLAPIVIGSIEYDGVLWFCYPKKSAKVKTDISRDVGWDVVYEAGLRPVTQVSIDPIWSALRFRPQERVGR